MRTQIIFLFIIFSNFLTHAQQKNIDDYLFVDVKGKSYYMYDFLSGGRNILIDFSAICCYPCKSTIQALNGIWNKYNCGEGGLNILWFGVNSGEDDNKLIIYRDANGIQYPMFSSPSNNGFTEMFYGRYTDCGGIPTFIFVGPNGKVRYIHCGRDTTTLKLAVDSLMSNPDYDNYTLPDVTYVDDFFGIYPSFIDNEQLNVEYYLKESCSIEYTIINSFGQEIQLAKLPPGNEKPVHKTILLNNLKPGFYFFIFKACTIAETRKFVVL